MKDNPKKKMLNVEITPELHRKIKSTAARDGVSLKLWSRMAFDYYLRARNKGVNSSESAPDFEEAKQSAALLAEKAMRGGDLSPAVSKRKRTARQSSS